MQDKTGRNIHYLRLSVTDRCNLRCRYCMPERRTRTEPAELLQYDEFLRLTKLFALCGVDTVRVTGGEPLVRPEVSALVAGLKRLPGIRRVALTTNGVLLEEQLPALLDAGLDSVNISLDARSAAVFQRITGFNALDRVWRSIQAALQSGLPVKLNCVPQTGVNETELEHLAELAVSLPLQVRFIEMMPIGYGASMPCLAGETVLQRLKERWPELTPLPAENSAVFGDGPAVYYRVPGWKGSVGLISAVHGKFCASCNRVRLTSRGFLRPCLASEQGADLRGPLRAGASDAVLLEQIRTTIWDKPREHHFEETACELPRTQGMYRIGG